MASRSAPAIDVQVPRARRRARSKNVVRADRTADDQPSSPTESARAFGDVTPVSGARAMARRSSSIRLR